MAGPTDRAVEVLQVELAKTAQSLTVAEEAASQANDKVRYLLQCETELQNALATVRAASEVEWSADDILDAKARISPPR